jgi:hypothetical protein
MEILNVIAAAVACWLFGAVWYNVLSKPWMAAAGLKVGADGRPEGGSSPMPFVISFVMMIIVAGMLRHVFGMTPTIDTVSKGIIAGIGIGAFVITPWLAINNAYTMRKTMLTLIDGAYATIGVAIIGGVLMAF